MKTGNNLSCFFFPFLGNAVDKSTPETGPIFPSISSTTLLCPFVLYSSVGFQLCLGASRKEEAWTKGHSWTYFSPYFWCSVALLLVRALYQATIAESFLGL